jgi:pyridinium-3,5-bisthiocarboxylic acid mononucleotide nickel chelatase
MRQAYLDCSAGISGDMFLAALIDAGAPVDKLFGELRKLTLGFYEFKRTRALRGGLMGTRVEIRVPGEQPHRHLADIQALIEKAALPQKAAGLAMKAFTRLAEVEGKLHNVPADEVHFHEVGAVDAIIDIVGACVGMELLEISELICSPLNVGSGQVNAAHGTLPVPSPATAELLKDIPMYSSGVQGELVTPTGAALVATLASGFGPLPAMKVARIGYGAGEKEFSDHPNIARLFVGEMIEPVTAQPGAPGDEVASVVEATVDEMNPQAYAHFVEQARAAGALDVTCSPAWFEKNRPGLAVHLVCEPEKVNAISQLLLEQTNATDVRIADVRRKVTTRERAEVETTHGDEIVSVMEATVDELSFQQFADFLEQARAAGALDITCSAARLTPNRPGVAISIVSAPDKVDELSQLLFQQTNATGVRVSEARRKVTSRPQPKLQPASGDELVSVIEANVDDMSPQLYGYFLEQALAAGALDVTCNSAQMKKNRPGLTISILCEPCKHEALAQLLFEQTTTIGVRIYEARRKVLEREQVAVETPYGTVQVKVARRDGKVLNAAPEFDDCRRLATEKSVPLKQVIVAAEAAYLQQVPKAVSA